MGDEPRTDLVGVWFTFRPYKYVEHWFYGGTDDEPT